MKIDMPKRQVAMLRKELEAHQQISSNGSSTCPRAIISTHSCSINKGLLDAIQEGDNPADGSQGAAGANAEETDERSPAGMEAPTILSLTDATSSLSDIAVSSDLRNWMMGYASQRQIISTIPGLSTHADVRGCESLGGGAECNSSGEVDAVHLAASPGSSDGAAGGAKGELEPSTEDVLMNHASADNLSLRAFEQGRITADTLMSRRQKHYAELRLLARALDRRARDAMLKLDAAVQGKHEAQERLQAVEAAACCEGKDVGRPGQAHHHSFRRDDALCEGKDIGEGGLFCRAEEVDVMQRVEELELENEMLKFLLREHEEQLENARADMCSVEFVM